MVYGYARISRDEDRNFVSIDNQKLIIIRYAETKKLNIDAWFVDDNISGYTFNRPGFTALLDALCDGEDIIICKDLSRLGRHNAKVLLFIEELKERGIRLLMADDDYDSFAEEDDILGIKTWYNERYIKDTSKKIRKMFKARQEAGTMIVPVPFGYKHVDDDKYAVEIVEREAEIIRYIDSLYLSGMGYRKIAYKLNEENILTPSQFMQQRDITNSKISIQWSGEMVRDILKNDYYTGTQRLRKRTRIVINGTDRRVPKEEQIVFPCHHEAIRSQDTHNKIQQLMSSRIRHNYRGVKRNESLFQHLLTCADCGARMIPAVQASTKYYICNTYNSKGNAYCSSHRILEKELVKVIIRYLEVCRDHLQDELAGCNITKHEERRHNIEKHIKELHKLRKQEKQKLQVLVEQKAADSAKHAAAVLDTVYDDLITTKLQAIQQINEEIDSLAKQQENKEDYKVKVFNALDIMNNIIAHEQLTFQDIDALVTSIKAEADRSLIIELKYGLGDYISVRDLVTRVSDDYQILRNILLLIQEETRIYTSNKYLRMHLKQLGYSVSQRKMEGWIEVLIQHDILRHTGNQRKPLSIEKSKSEMKQIIERFEGDTYL